MKTLEVNENQVEILQSLLGQSERSLKNYLNSLQRRGLNELASEVKMLLEDTTELLEKIGRRDSVVIPLSDGTTFDAQAALEGVRDLLKKLQGETVYTDEEYEQIGKDWKGASDVDSNSTVDS